jgi:hypothetical protein
MLGRLKPWNKDKNDIIDATFMHEKEDLRVAFMSACLLWLPT